MLQEKKNINNLNIPTGFFGKLPGFTDFIKYNAAGNEILTIDNWMQEGLALAKLKYKNEWKDYYNNSLCLKFIYPFTGTDNTTIGVIFPSSDKSGRSFPFIMFHNIKKQMNDRSSFYLIPSAHSKIFNFLEDVIEENKLAQDTLGLKSLTDSLKLPDTNDVLNANYYKKFISETKLSDIFILGNDNQFNLNDLFENDIKIFEHFICFNYTANLNNSNNCLLLSYFVQLLQSVFKHSDTAPGIFYSQLDDKSWLLFLIFTKPSPKDFIDLLLYNKASLMSTEASSSNYKKEFHTGNSLFRDNSLISGSTSLIEFLNSIRNHLY